MVEGRLRAPRLASGRVFVDAYVQRSEFPDEDFFGLGPDSLRQNDVTYGLRNTVIGGRAGYSPLRWLTLAGTVERLNPAVSTINEPGSIHELFSDADAPDASRLNALNSAG